jgi:hypothetical protein
MRIKAIHAVAVTSRGIVKILNVVKSATTITVSAQIAETIPAHFTFGASANAFTRKPVVAMRALHFAIFAVTVNL